MRPVTSLVIGSVLLPVGLLVGLGWIPSGIADLGDYSRSGSCPSTNIASRNCWTEVSAVVAKTVVIPRLRGNSDWEVFVTDQFGSQKATVAHRSAFDRLHAGDAVTARFWDRKLVLLRIPTAEDLPTDDEPGRNLLNGILALAFTLLCGVVFFLGGIGLHRHERSWTRSASRAEWGEHLFDAVSPPTRRWFQLLFAVCFVGLCSVSIGWVWFDASPLPIALITIGLCGLGWAWLLHHRARMVMERGARFPKQR